MNNARLAKFVTKLVRRPPPVLWARLDAPVPADAVLVVRVT